MKWALALTLWQACSTNAANDIGQAPIEGVWKLGIGPNPPWLLPDTARNESTNPEPPQGATASGSSQPTEVRIVRIGCNGTQTTSQIQTPIPSFDASAASEASVAASTSEAMTSAASAGQPTSAAPSGSAPSDEPINPALASLLATPSELPGTSNDQDAAAASGQSPASAPGDLPLHAQAQAQALSSNIFVPIATSAPPSSITTRKDHPVARLGLATQNRPYETNKFYANFFLGNRNQATFTHPYSLTWSKGGGATKSWGMAVSHIDASQKAFASGNPPEYFINPIGIQSMVMSATELGSSTALTMDSLTAFSANVNLLTKSGAGTAIRFPLVQGMGFVTGIYNNVTPVIQSGVLFRSISSASFTKVRNTTKYKIVLEDGSNWLLYATTANGKALSLSQKSNSQLQASGAFQGTIQIAKNPGGSAGETVYDNAANVFPQTAALSGTVSGSTGSYTLKYTKAGLGSTTPALLQFALPHHVASFDSTTTKAKTSVQLQTTTKGLATAYAADSWTLQETNLPTDMTFAPWSPTLRSQTKLASAAISAISPVAKSEVGQDMNAQTNLDSMYYSGKALSKFATIVYTIHDLVKDTATASSGLDRLKTAFNVFSQNKQQNPLTYESAWGGVVSSASYKTGDSGVDFGNSYYNDHHFHYGYFLHAAAIIGSLDATWLSQNKDYVNSLARDVANPSSDDTYFPIFRSFDWYHGHSWAKGLFESGDGKDEESSSEDVMFAYGMKMWGKTVGDANMEARGNLMLSVLARSLQNYFLLESTNKNQPSQFIPNKVTGILFENKVDHTTYFGTNPEYIEGIHMIPLIPASTLTRTKNFVSEEWKTYFDSGRVDKVAGGWRGILYANLAITDAKTSYNFFNQKNFDSSLLDGGASRTWYLAYAAGLGGAS